jgi:hypothetical protein
MGSFFIGVSCKTMSHFAIIAMKCQAAKILRIPAKNKNCLTFPRFLYMLPA